MNRKEEFSKSKIPGITDEHPISTQEKELDAEIFLKIKKLKKKRRSVEVNTPR